MLNIQHVIWDWNGTLLNDLPIAHAVLNQILAKYSKPTITQEKYQLIYRHPIIEMYHELGFDFKDITYESIADEWHDLYIEKSNKALLHSDALHTLEVIKTRGLAQSVLSALPHHILIEHIKKFSIQDYFSHISGLADSSGCSKIENGKILLGNLNLDKDKVIIIGDSTHDIETASALGIKHYIVTRGLEHRDRLAQHNCMLFNNFIELLAHLDL